VPLLWVVPAPEWTYQDAPPSVERAICGVPATLPARTMLAGLLPA
jgi:hypothetical protein